MISNQAQNKSSIGFLDERKKKPTHNTLLNQNSGFFWMRGDGFGQRTPVFKSTGGKLVNTNSNLRLERSHFINC